MQHPIFEQTIRPRAVRPMPMKAPVQVPALGALGEMSDTSRAIWGAVYTAAAAASAYHGYKRTGSAGWAFGWFVFGGLMPFFALPLAVAEGFAKPKKGRRR